MLLSISLSALAALLLVTTFLLTCNELANRGLFFIGKTGGYSAIAVIVAISAFGGFSVTSVIDRAREDAAVSYTSDIKELRQIGITPKPLAFTPKQAELFARLTRQQDRISRSLQAPNTLSAEDLEKVELSDVIAELKRENMRMEQTLSTVKQRHGVIAQNELLRRKLVKVEIESRRLEQSLSTVKQRQGLTLQNELFKRELGKVSE